MLHEKGYTDTSGYKIYKGNAKLLLHAISFDYQKHNN